MFLCGTLKGLVGQSFVMKVDILEVVEAIVSGFELDGVDLSTFVVAHCDGLSSDAGQV
jgi:hypothetical protein